MKHSYAVQHAGRPYGGGEGPIDWLEYSTHTTLRGAVRAERKALSDMRQACGPNAWNNHFRVVSLCDQTSETNVNCPSCGQRYTLKFHFAEDQHIIDGLTCKYCWYPVK